MKRENSAGEIVDGLLPSGKKMRANEEVVRLLIPSKVSGTGGCRSVVCSVLLKLIEKAI